MKPLIPLHELEKRANVMALQRNRVSDVTAEATLGYTILTLIDIVRKADIMRHSECYARGPAVDEYVRSRARFKDAYQPWDISTNYKVTTGVENYVKGNLEEFGKTGYVKIKPMPFYNVTPSTDDADKIERIKINTVISREDPAEDAEELFGRPIPKEAANPCVELYEKYERDLSRSLKIPSGFVNATLVFDVYCQFCTETTPHNHVKAVELPEAKRDPKFEYHTVECRKCGEITTNEVPK